ncbi:uracil-DNA glycosylase [Inquilinus sp. CAU 1745]|uniref:uracil-DNA glycosylase n=1 Tax=Inquilinus sp. CAU 1745 TaxID=3140369 RepID=UPI00325A82E2
MTETAPHRPPQPSHDCPLCPRLEAFREKNRRKFPDFHNAPVPGFGPGRGRLLIVGLAPGLKGANATGRPFTGDYAGDLLYATLDRFGFSKGTFKARPDDGLKLLDCRIVNAVRCVPPENKPKGKEVSTCRQFLEGELQAMTELKAIVALGVVAHKAVVAALGLRQVAHPFKHGAVHALPDDRFLADSYHCSRYNTNTGRLTTEMFQSVFAEVRRRLDED